MAPLEVCDAHLHVFGPPSRFPVVVGGTADPGASLERYEAAVAGLGIGRRVLVQPSAYGGDNRCLLEALAALGPEAARGVVAVGADRPDDATLGAWQALGVRGLRCICFPPGTKAHAVGPGWGPTEGWSEEVRPRLSDLATLAAEVGWHLDLLAPGWLLVELLDLLEAMPVEVCLAHLGMFPAAGGVDQPGFRALLGLLAGEGGHAWLKLTGPYRITGQGESAGVAAMARAAYEVAPDRVIWGSDFPHLSFGAAVDTSAMLDQVVTWFPGEEPRRRILAENPARLFGFGEPGASVGTGRGRP